MNRVLSEYQHGYILTKALSLDVFVINRCFLMDLKDLLIYFVFAVDQRFYMCVLISICCVCLCYDTAEGLS